jgi:leucyl/phenylalanyl-tRNA---protein transferase
MPVRCCPDWDSFKITPSAAGGPVAFSADLSPASMLDAYKNGIFPIPAADEYARNVNEFRYEDQVAAGVIGVVGSPHDDPFRVAWWSPDPRPVIRAGDIHLGRNVRKQLRRGQEWTTADHSFRRVAEECRVRREPRWFTDALLASMVELHEQGWAHSIEVWQDGDLIGGAFGVGVGRALSGDSIFNRRPNAARIAVADMAARFALAGGTLIDAQWDSSFLRSLGAQLMPRDDYLPLLAGPAERRALPREPLPARRLIARWPLGSDPGMVRTLDLRLHGIAAKKGPL